MFNIFCLSHSIVYQAQRVNADRYDIIFFLPDSCSHSCGVTRPAPPGSGPPSHHHFHHHMYPPHGIFRSMRPTLTLPLQSPQLMPHQAPPTPPIQDVPHIPPPGMDMYRPQMTDQTRACARPPRQHVQPAPPRMNADCAHSHMSNVMEVTPTPAPPMQSEVVIQTTPG